MYAVAVVGSNQQAMKARFRVRQVPNDFRTVADNAACTYCVAVKQRVVLRIGCHGFYPNRPVISLATRCCDLSIAEGNAFDLRKEVAFAYLPDHHRKLGTDRTRCRGIQGFNDQLNEHKAGCIDVTRCSLRTCFDLCSERSLPRDDLSILRRPLKAESACFLKWEKCPNLEGVAFSDSPSLRRDAYVDLRARSRPTRKHRHSRKHQVLAIRGHSQKKDHKTNVRAHGHSSSFSTAPIPRRVEYRALSSRNTFSRKLPLDAMSSGY